MRRPLDPALTAELHESWDYDDVHKNWEKEHFFCPLCWEYHTMLKKRGELFCPMNHVDCGGLPKIIINRIYWHFDNIFEIMKQEPHKYQVRVKKMHETMAHNRAIELAKDTNQKEAQVKEQTQRAVSAESNNAKLQKKIDELQLQIDQLRGQMNGGGGGVTKEAMDYLASRISWSIGEW